VNGATIAGPITQAFTEAGSPPSFFPPTGITVTPVTAQVAAAASVRRAK
jgi:hypothetical protein